MSTWRVGAESAAIVEGAADGLPESFTPGADAPAGADGLNSAVDKLTKWIPGDALALYVAAVTAFAAGDEAKPSPVLLIVFIVLSAAFVVGGAFAVSGDVPRSVFLPAILAAVAFAIWTLSVPFGGWQRLDVVEDNRAGVAIVAAVTGVLFGFFAEGLTKRAARREAQRRRAT